MKTFTIKSIILALFTVLSSLASYSQISKAEIIATGLTCSMCSNAINKQLKSMSEVDSISTDLNTNTFTVYFKKDSDLAPKVVKNAVEKAGFFVGNMVLTMQIPAGNFENNTAKIGNATFLFIDSKVPVPNTAMQFRVLDKGFVTQKEYKKLAKSYSKYPSYATDNENMYHLKAI